MAEAPPEQPHPPPRLPKRRGPHRAQKNNPNVIPTTHRAAIFCQSIGRSITADASGAIPHARTEFWPLHTVDLIAGHACLSAMQPPLLDWLRHRGWVSAFGPALVVGLVALCGCSASSRAQILMPAPDFPAVIRPLDASVGSVVLVNERLRFVVLDYSFSTLPPTGSFMEVYRSSNRVGRVRLSRWSNPTTAAADIIDGAPQIGDTARPD